MLHKIYKKFCHMLRTLLRIDGEHEKEVEKIKREISFQSIITQEKVEYTNYMLKKTIAGDINKAVRGIKS